MARFTAAVGELTRRQGARCWVEKSPEHVYHAAAIVTRFPGARIVHVVRDGRDVVTSILHTPWAVPHARGRRSRVVAGAVLWELMTFAGLRVLADSTFGPTVLAVRYESLVREPTVELRRLAAFLGLPDDDDSVAGWLCRTREIKANSLIEPELRGIGSSPVGRWRERRHLAENEVAIVQYLVGSTLVRAGYELVETKPLSRTACALAAAAKAAWLAIRAERYATTIGRGAPPHFVADASASLLQLLGRAGPRGKRRCPHPSD